MTSFLERSPTLTVWEKRCWKKPDLNFTQGKHQSATARFALASPRRGTLTKVSWLLDHVALVVASAVKDYSVNATTAEIHLRLLALCTVPAVALLRLSVLLSQQNI